MAYELFRTKWLPDEARKGSEISDDFIDLVNGDLGTEIVDLVEKKLGKTLDANQKGKLIKELKEANNPVPTINQSIEALCSFFGVEGYSSEMGRLRSALFHRGSTDGLSFEEVGQLYIDLSEIMAVCLLKALNYSGRYIPNDRSRIEHRPLPHGDYREMVE
jgi:hypothetical protein